MPALTTKSKRFLIADDHTIIRSGLSLLLKGMHPGSVIDETENGAGIIAALKQHKYDLIIMDIQMPKTETLWLINFVQVNYPTIPILVHSMAAENVYALRVLKAGAKGFVSKDSPIEEVSRAINLAIEHRTYISLVVADILSTQNTKLLSSPFCDLSPRELQVVSLLLAGNTVTEISKILDIKHSTVGTHKGKVFKKLKVTNLLELKTLSDIYR